ncbi:MAG: hypothetical protein HY858_13040 [Candidatus Solibacter usitatus]|nr:hypothetical protein [Candidatus Solibacter usitatus]
MLLLKYLMITVGALLLSGASAILVYDLYQALRARRRAGRPDGAEPERPARSPEPLRWRIALKLGLLSLLPLLAGLSILVVPSGFAAIRVSQVSGPRPGTLYPGVHAIVPLIERAELYNTRDSVFSIVLSEDPKKSQPGLRAQTREGLTVGLAVALRYRLDPSRLYAIHTSLPEDAGEQVVAPIVASAFRETSTNFGVRELFSTKREEVRLAAAATISRRLASDGLLVKEVILRDVQLPLEYSRGLEAMLLREQQNERLTVELVAKEKEVKVAQMEASSQKEIAIKQAEGMAQAKLLDSRAELERLKLMAEAEENKIRRVANANSEKLRLEAEVLKQNPMLIQKIIAERLSDKVQIMMIPADVKNFFATDVLRGAMMPSMAR